jgi:hypothetical protein
MKKYIIYFIGVIILNGCSANNPVDVTLAIPLAPTTLTGSLTTSTQITLNWTDNSTNETGFKIERKIATGNYSQIGSIGGDITTYIDNSLLLSTSYTYRVLSYNATGNSLTYSNEFSIITSNPLTIPVLTTNSVSAITSITAISGGNITYDGGSAIISRGVVWSTSTNPTISLSTKTSDGFGIGSFTSNISSLALNVKYYIRAFATNAVGTSYGNEISFNASYVIGETGPAGGIIFYDKGVFSNGWRYLEANYINYSSGIVWWNGTWIYQDKGGISPNTGLGEGKANTLLIIAANNTLSNAAKVCDDYIANGFTDWYLPSSDELQLMCQNLYSVGKGNFSEGFYWSSTDSNRIHNAHWNQFFRKECAPRTDSGRNMTNLVRPIRQF